jgi:hypothetical protein
VDMFFHAPAPDTHDTTTFSITMQHKIIQSTKEKARLFHRLS